MDVVSTCSACKCRMVFCVLWAIWIVRNKEVHEGAKKSSHESVVSIKTYLKKIDDLAKNLPT